jgi:hypothetical protein
MLLYILEQRSSQGTLQIRPSWPHSKLKLSPTSGLTPQACILLPRSLYLVVYYNGSSFTPAPSTIWVASHYCTSKHYLQLPFSKSHEVISSWKKLQILKHFVLFFRTSGYCLKNHALCPFYAKYVNKSKRVTHIWARGGSEESIIYSVLVKYCYSQ